MLPPRAFNRRIEGRRRASWSHAVVLGLALSAADAMGFDQGRDEKLRVAQTEAGRTNRVRRMDAGRPFEAFQVCRAEGR
jgi:hypothetical protein